MVVNWVFPTLVHLFWQVSFWTLDVYNILDSLHVQWLTDSLGVYCKLLSSHLSWYKFSPQNMQTSAILKKKKKKMNGSNTNMAVFSWEVYLIVTSFIPFYVTCLLGIVLIHAMPYRSNRPARALSSFPTKTKALKSFHLTHFHFILAVCVFVSSAQIREYSSKIRTLSCSVQLKRRSLITICVFWSIC